MDGSGLIECKLGNEVALTEKDFIKFKRHFLYWIKKFSLEDWEYHFEFDTQTLESKEDAVVYADLQSKTMQVIIYQHTQRDIYFVAFHEACEALLAHLSVLARERFATENEIIQAIHGVIRRLENIFYKKSGIRK